MSRYPATVKWAMQRSNGWLIWDVARFRTFERACGVKLVEKE